MVAEAGGRLLVVGEDVLAAADTLQAAVVQLWTCEAGAFAPAAWAGGLAVFLLDEPHVVLPGSPDGRDLAGRLAAALDRDCRAWCTEVRSDRTVSTRSGGVESVTVPVTGPFVATLVPRPVASKRAAGALPVAVQVPLTASGFRDAMVVAVEDADPGEVDLAEAERIVAGGVGLGGEEEFGVLAAVAEALGAAVGATRPIADRGTVGPERQIGTTGAAVDPTLYLAFGISGAVQHTAGLGTPERIVSVNTDAACPMMSMADLAVVADAAATVRALARRLGAATS